MKDRNIALTVLGVGGAGVLAWYLWSQYQASQSGSLNFAIGSTDPVTGEPIAITPDATWRCGITAGGYSIYFYVDGQPYCLGNPLTAGTHTLEIRSNTGNFSLTVTIMKGITTWVTVVAGATEPTFQTTYAPPSGLRTSPFPPA